MPGALGIVSVCHGVGLAAAARCLLPEWNIVEIPVWYLVTPEQRQTAIDSLSTMDRVFIAPLGPQYGPLAAERVTTVLPAAFLFPPLTFFGFHPDMTMLLDPYRVQFAAPVDDYHSKIVLAAYATGHTVAETARLINPLVLAKLGYFDAYAHEVETVGSVFRAYGIELAPWFSRWKALGCFMHTPNHPSQAVLGDLMQAALEAAGIPFQAGAPLHAIPDMFADRSRMPVYPPLAAQLGVPGSMEFQVSSATNPNDRQLAFETFVARCFETYARAPAKALSTAIGVEQALELLEH